MSVPSIEDAPSTGYGDEAALLRDLSQVPMIAPDEIPTLDAPTARPDEPLETGLPTGAGAGPEVLGAPVSEDPTRMALQAMSIVFPNNDLFRLMDTLDLQGR
jgi:hypothetical protein